MIPQHLLLRLLSNPLLYKGEVNLTLDRLPDRLPVELPILKQAKVVASLAYGKNSFYIFLDIPDSPQKIQTTYRNIFIGKGWQQLPRNEADIFCRLGFNYRLDPDFTNTITFCNKQNTSLSLTTLPPENSITKAILKLELDPFYSPCKAEWEDSINNVPMPILIDPPQTEITKSIVNSGGENSYNTTAIITTKLERKTLLVSYYSQMEEMGWTKITEVEENLLSIGLWQYQDSDRLWRGLFNWTQSTKKNDKYLVDFQVEQQSFIDRSFATAIQAIPLNSDKLISRNLAQHILKNVFKNDKQEGQLLVGRLPSLFPLELPLPDNAEIIGSLNAENSLIILLEVPQSPARIEIFYRQQLTAAYWKKYDYYEVFKKHGFISSGCKPVEMNIFCNKKQGWEIHFNTYPSQANYTDLRLQIKKISSNSFCSVPLNQNRDNTEVLLKKISAPSLTAPEKAEVLFLNPFGGSGIHSSGNRDGDLSLIKYNSGAIVKTKLSIEELTSHYFAQMSEYSWTKVSEIKRSAIATGLWMLQNEQGKSFQATMNMVKNPVFPQQYAASLSIIPTELE